MADIRVDKLGKAFGSATALDDVSIEVRDREFVVLLGPSGCGKTTLLRIIAGLEQQTNGRVYIGGRDVSDEPPRTRGLAMVFQNYAVFPHLTVFENVAFGLRMAKVDQDKVKAKVEEAASLLHIEPFLQRYPDQLSGGQRQRVAVARALAVEPAVLLMDEPLSNLDALLRMEMRAELKSVLARSNTTTVYVTHDQTEAMGLADRIAVMERGRIVQYGAPMEVYARPATIFVGGFIGNPPMNFLRVTAQSGRVQAGALNLAAPVADGDAILGVRAEELEIVGPDAGIPATIRVVEPLGPHLLITARHAEQELRVIAGNDLAARSGESVGLKPRPEAVRWFTSEGRALAAIT
jgi:multiple sugar transport system ATP-binding protein